MIDPLDETQYLVGRAREGDKHSYRTLVERHMPFVYALCWARTTDASAARRLAEGAFIAAYRNLWAAPKKGFRRWLHDTFRENMLSSHHSGGSTPEGHPLDLLTGMPLRSREFIAVHCAGGLGLDDVARAFGESASSVSSAFAMLGQDHAAQDGHPCHMIDSLPTLLDDALPLKKKASITAHIDQCDECRSALATLQGTLAAFKAAFQELLPGQESIERVISALPDGAPAPPQRPPPIRMLVTAWMLAIAAVILGIILFLLTRR